jgi:hypothetical protein
MSKVFQFYGPQTADKVEVLYDIDGCVCVRDHTDGLTDSREAIIWILVTLFISKFLEYRGDDY